MSGSVGVVVGLINAWRQAMAAHPVKTMVISFVVAAGISVMLMAMWLVVLALIRARAESFHLPISAVARIVPDGM